ncbi:hypothetical protein TDB9533_03865 [Thalassocella blandensis]|nr:hypothetical protein TDB9533_03865 [Thalassocella blandensis]
MKRHYYVHQNLDEVYSVERQLVEAGMSEYQIHVLSENDAAVDAYRLHSVGSFFRRDIIYAGFVGLAIGIAAAVLVLLVGTAIGVSDAMWVPTIFLALILLGFCTWEGGLWGIQETNKEFARFEQELKDGKHVLMVDVKPDQEDRMIDIISGYKTLKDAGLGAASPEWVVGAQHNWNKFVHWAP